MTKQTFTQWVLLVRRCAVLSTHAPVYTAWWCDDQAMSSSLLNAIKWLIRRKPAERTRVSVRRKVDGGVTGKREGLRLASFLCGTFKIHNFSAALLADRQSPRTQPIYWNWNWRIKTPHWPQWICMPSWESDVFPPSSAVEVLWGKAKLGTQWIYEYVSKRILIWLVAILCNTDDKHEIHSLISTHLRIVIS